MLAYPSEEITRNAAEATEIVTTGQWGPCEACLQVKTKRFTVLNMTDKKANVKGKRFYVDVGGAMKHLSLGGNNYVIIFEDDCTRFKVAKFEGARATRRSCFYL